MRPATAIRALEAASPSWRSSVHCHATRYQSTSSEATTTNATAGPSKVSKDLHIPPLPRPLGVDHAPVASPKTFVKKSDKWYDGERLNLERQALMKEASRGYFHDYHRASRGTGGKGWIAPKVLIRQDKALWFPNIAGTDLNGQSTNSTDLLKGKTSLVAILSTRLSEEHVNRFVQPTLEDQGERLNYVRINHQANYLKATLLSFFLSSLKRQVAQDHWSKFMMARGEWSAIDINQPMGIENKIVGYLYLVDKDCKIRWAGVGDPNDEEIQSLRTAAGVLLQREKQA